MISKLLANRLKTAPPVIIDNSQGTFTGESQILDGVLVAKELVASRLKSEKGFLMKIDIETVYDHVK